MRILLFVLVTLISCFAEAETDSSIFLPKQNVRTDDEDCGKPNCGWYWYERDPDKLERDAKKNSDLTQPSTQDKSEREKKPMSVSWLKEMMPKLLDQAIDNPTPENLAAYLYVQRVYVDKSQRYAELAQQFVYSQPMLDENNRVPLSAYGKNVFADKAYKSKETALKHLAQEVGGLMVFFDSKCDFCKAQIRIINYLSDTYGFAVKYISMDGKGLPGIKEWVPDNGHAKLLELKVYPTTVFAVPPKTYLVVSQGMMAKDQLADRILTAASSNKLLPADMDKDVNPYDRGVLTVEDMQDGASDNPEEVVKYIKEHLKQRY